MVFSSIIKGTSSILDTLDDDSLILAVLYSGFYNIFDYFLKSVFARNLGYDQSLIKGSIGGSI